MIPVLFGVLAITFLISHLVPADPVGAYLGKQANNQELRQLVIERYHFDEPIYVQFGYYLVDIFQGDLGYSLVERRDVSDIIVEKLPATLELVTVALLIAIPMGIYLGVISATKRNKASDVVSRLVALLGISVPTFFLALSLQVILATKLGLFPIGGRYPVELDPPGGGSGFYLLNSLLALDLVAFLTSLYYVMLPGFALGFSMVGYILRMTRSSMLEVMSSDYVRAARAKGVPEKTVINKHALRNAMGPTLTVVGLTVGGAITYTVFVEEIFNWPGIGQVAVKWTTEPDFAGIMGFTILVTVAFLVANLAVDLLYVYFDPQVRLGGKGTHGG
jgi:peptide/nickel transport system permease protein